MTYNDNHREYIYINCCYTSIIYHRDGEYHYNDIMGYIQQLGSIIRLTFWQSMVAIEHLPRDFSGTSSN